MVGDGSTSYSGKLIRVIRQLETGLCFISTHLIEDLGESLARSHSADKKTRATTSVPTAWMPACRSLARLRRPIELGYRTGTQSAEVKTLKWGDLERLAVVLWHPPTAR